MKKTVILMICLSCFFYYGCAAMLVPYTSDPQKKMEWSIYLSNVNRPIPARRLLLEAIQIIEEDDKALMANYYLARGISSHRAATTLIGKVAEQKHGTVK